jgi:hypothetical protein
MSQSKKQSLIETITQTVVGLAVSVCIQAIVYPLMGIPVRLNQNLVITIIFFLASLLRGYLLRRVFNKSK